MRSDIADRLTSFLNKEPEKVIEWHDNFSEARGWLVINSLHNGAAGGGTRMRADCEESEIRQLAKIMEIKFTVSGPSIGGAKSGIRYDFKNNQDRLDVLGRWFAFIKNELQKCYGTGGDQNVDLVRHVIPILRSLGIQHPQEGVVSGLYPNISASEKASIIKNLNQGVALKLKRDQTLSSLNYTISDIATGLGVVSSIERYYQRTDGTLSGKKVIIEGFGNVGAGAAFFLARAGAKVVGIIDKEWHIFDDAGIDIIEMLKLKRRSFTDVKNGTLREGISESENYPNADIFIPAATSCTIDFQRIGMLRSVGVSLIASGANNPFSSMENEKKADEFFGVLPDFIANSGMARCYSYLMSRDCIVNEDAIMNSIISCVYSTVDEVINRGNSEKNMLNTAYEIALDRIENRE